MTADQLPLFDDDPEDERAERQRIVRERLAQIELDRMYRQDRETRRTTEFCVGCGYWPATYGRHRSTCQSADDSEPRITSYEPDELWAAETRRLSQMETERR
jgi:hypothetical protein